MQSCHQEVDQFDDHNKCDDLIKNQNTFTAISFNEGEMWSPELWTCEGGEADSELGLQCCPVVFIQVVWRMIITVVKMIMMVLMTTMALIMMVVMMMMTWITKVAA